MKNSLVTLLSLTLVLAGIFYLINSWQPAWISSNYPWLIGIYFGLTALTLGLNKWAVKNKSLVTVFIASQVLRIIFSLALLYLLMSKAPEEANVLVINFFIVYLCYLIFEIITVLSNLRAEFRGP